MMPNIYTYLLFSAKNLSDLVNESLTLSEEATIAVSADVSRLSSPPPTASQTLHSTSSGGEGSSPLSSTATGTTGEIVQETNTGDNSRVSSDERQIREFKGGMVFGANRKILPGPPPERLVAITNNMNSHLTSLLVCYFFQCFFENYVCCSLWINRKLLNVLQLIIIFFHSGYL